MLVAVIMKTAVMLQRVTSSKTIVPAAWATAVIGRRRRGAVETAIRTSLAVLGADVLKRCVWRQRPRLWTGTPEQSFPSGHSAASTAYFLGLALMVSPRYRPMAIGGAAALASAVNVLRVTSRYHWVSDVIAGDVLAVAGITTAHVAMRALRTRELTDPSRADRHGVGAPIA